MSVTMTMKPRKQATRCKQTLFAPGKSWDNVRFTAAPYTESRLAHLVRNKCVGFPVVEQLECFFNCWFKWAVNYELGRV